MLDPTSSYISHYNNLLPPNKEWFSPKEFGAVIGTTDQFVRDAFDSQKIFGHLFSGRASNGKEKRKSYRIHRDALLLYLVQTANYDPPDFVACIKDLLKNRSRQQLCELQQCVEQLLKESQ